MPRGVYPRKPKAKLPNGERQIAATYLQELDEATRRLVEHLGDVQDRAGGQLKMIGQLHDLHKSIHTVLSYVGDSPHHTTGRRRGGARAA